MGSIFSEHHIILMLGFGTSVAIHQNTSKQCQSDFCFAVSRRSARGCMLPRTGRGCLLQHLPPRKTGRHLGRVSLLSLHILVNNTNNSKARTLGQGSFQPPPLKAQDWCINSACFAYQQAKGPKISGIRCAQVSNHAHALSLPFPMPLT